MSENNQKFSPKLRFRYNLYCTKRDQEQRKFLSYDLWKQEYATQADLQEEALHL